MTEMDKYLLVNPNGLDQEQSILSHNYIIHNGIFLEPLYSVVYPLPYPDGAYYLDELPSDSNLLTAGQCVPYVQWKTGVSYSGNAITWQKYINSEIPVEGAIVVTTHSYWGHVGIVKDIVNNNVLMESRNFKGLYIVSQDWLDINNPQILGYIVFDKLN